jgi:hypothetical protein
LNNDHVLSWVEARYNLAQMSFCVVEIYGDHHARPRVSSSAVTLQERSYLNSISLSPIFAVWLL